MGTWNPGPGPTSGSDTFFGDSADDNVDGLAGNDYLIGGYGADTLNGSAGDDTFRPGNDLQNDYVDGGADYDTLIFSDVIEDGLIIDANQAFRTYYGDTLFDTFYGIEAIFGSNAGDYIASNYGDVVVVYAGNGNDYMSADTAPNYITFYGGAGSDIFSAGGTDFAIGDFQVGVDYILGNITAIAIDGADTLITTGASTIRAIGINSLNLAQWQAQTALIQVTFPLGANATNPSGGSGVDWLRGTTDNDILNGAAGNDTLMGAQGNDVLDGGANNDTLEGGTGDDTLTGGDGNDFLKGDNGADSVNGGNGNDTLAGGYTDIFIGDTINGGDGTDTLFVLASNGSVRFDYATLLSIEALAFGEDRGIEDYSEATFNSSQFAAGFAPTLITGSALENIVRVNLDTSTFSAAGIAFANWTGLDRLIITGSVSNDAITGSAVYDEVHGGDGLDTINGGGGNDQLYGDNGADTLDGGAGADQMYGGLDNDIYYYNTAGDFANENLSEGYDIIRTTMATTTLSANVERLELLTGAVTGYGNSLDNYILGNGAANTLFGYDGADVLDGGVGADQMYGGNGNDTYYVDNAGDVTSEASALGGVDIVYSSINRALTANIENLTLTGTAAIGYGNIIDNTIVGNATANTLYGFEGNDRLDGGAGVDTMFGAAGNDTYVVDNANDVTVEGIAGPAGGIDTIESSVDRGLNANIENLMLTGAAVTGYGNVLDNVIVGNSAANSIFGFDGNDTLDGGVGADQMFGGNGNDTYIVDNAGDVTSEASVSGGIDTVISSVGRTLTANIENLTLIGSASVTGSGNALANNIIGNSGANTLYGLDGADTLDGGLGADVLQGGAGADTYVFSTAIGGGNVDVIFGYNVADDTIYLNNDVFTGLSTGALAAGAFNIGAAAADADDRIIYNSGTGQLYFDADGNGAGAAVLFATLSPGLALTSADFIVGGP